MSFFLLGDYFFLCARIKLSDDGEQYVAPNPPQNHFPPPPGRTSSIRRKFIKKIIKTNRNLLKIIQIRPRLAH